MTPSPRFFRRFQTNVVQSDTDKIDIDIVKGGQRAAAYTAPVNEGVIMEKDGFTTATYKIPYIKLKMASEADKWLTRSAGETPYTLEGPAARAARALIDDFDYLGRNLDVEEERRRAEAFALGQISIRDERAQAIRVIQFGLTQTGSPAVKWTPATSFNDALEYLRARIADITATGAPAPTDIVAAGDAGNVLIRIFNPSSGASYLSAFRVDRGLIDSRAVEPGVMYLGYFRELGRDVWIYNGRYRDLDGALKPFVPAGKLLMLSANARHDMNYGAIQNYNAGFAAVPRFPSTWIEQDRRARFPRLESAPLFVPHQIDSAGSFDVA